MVIAEPVAHLGKLSLSALEPSSKTVSRYHFPANISVFPTEEQAGTEVLGLGIFFPCHNMQVCSYK